MCAKESLSMVKWCHKLKLILQWLTTLWHEITFLRFSNGVTKYFSRRRTKIITSSKKTIKTGEPAHDIMPLLSSVKSFFKHACAAVHWGYTSYFWSDPSSTSIRYVREQRRLWREAQSRLSSLAWAFAVRLCDKYHNLMSWLSWKLWLAIW